MAEENTPAVPAGTDPTPQPGTAPAASPAATPDGLGDAGQKALQAERKARQVAEKQAKEYGEQLQALEDAKKSNEQRSQERAEKAERDAAAANLKLLRLEVASAKGLTASQAARLTGSTREEIETDAEAYLTEVKPRTTTSFDGGVRKTADAPADMNSLIRQRAGY